MKKIDTHYVSPIDQFLKEYDEKNPKKSESQKNEIKKYERIARLRDKKNEESEPEQTLWEGTC